MRHWYFNQNLPWVLQWRLHSFAEAFRIAVSPSLKKALRKVFSVSVFHRGFPASLIASCRESFNQRFHQSLKSLCWKDARTKALQRLFNDSLIRDLLLIRCSSVKHVRAMMSVPYSLFHLNPCLFTCREYNMYLFQLLLRKEATHKYDWLHVFWSRSYIWPNPVFEKSYPYARPDPRDPILLLRLSCEASMRV